MCCEESGLATYVVSSRCCWQEPGTSQPIRNQEPTFLFFPHGGETHLPDTAQALKLPGKKCHPDDFWSQWDILKGYIITKLSWQVMNASTNHLHRYMFNSLHLRLHLVG